MLPVIKNKQYCKLQVSKLCTETRLMKVNWVSLKKCNMQGLKNKQYFRHLRKTAKE